MSNSKTWKSKLFSKSFLMTFDGSLRNLFTPSRWSSMNRSLILPEYSFICCSKLSTSLNIYSSKHIHEFTLLMYSSNCAFCCWFALAFNASISLKQLTLKSLNLFNLLLSHNKFTYFRISSIFLKMNLLLMP